MKNLFYIVAGVLVGFLLGRLSGCGLLKPCPCESAGVKVTTTLKVDSATTGWYRPAAADSFLPLEGGHIPDPGQLYRPSGVKVAAGTVKSGVFKYAFFGRSPANDLSSDFDLHYYGSDSLKLYSSAGGWVKPPEAPVFFYSDTVKLVGSDSTHYGTAIIQDTTEGKIRSRRVLTRFSIPVTTRTITLPPRAIVFFGIGGAFNVQDPELYVGPSLMLKTRRDMVYEVGGMINTRSQWLLQGSMKFPIRLRR